MDDSFLIYSSDNKIKVWFDGSLIINDWTASASRTLSATVTVTANTFHTLKIEYGSLTGLSDIKLEMENGTVFPRQVVKAKNLYPKEQTYKKWEINCTFNDRTNFKDALKRVLFLCNSSYQFANGKFRFFCFDELTTPTFTFDSSNIIKGSIKPSFPENLNAPNRFIGIGNDLNEQFMGSFSPQVVHQLEDFQDLSTQVTEQIIDVANSTRYHTLKLLKFRAKLENANTMQIELEGKPISMQVLAGDLVKINYAKYNWVNKLCLVIARNKRLAMKRPQNLGFTLKEWSL